MSMTTGAAAIKADPATAKIFGPPAMVNPGVYPKRQSHSGLHAAADIARAQGKISLAEALDLPASMSMRATSTRS